MLDHVIVLPNCPSVVTNKSEYLLKSSCRLCCWDGERSEDDKSKTELDDWVDVLGVLLSMPMVKRFCAGVQCPIAVFLYKVTRASINHLNNSTACTCNMAQGSWKKEVARDIA